MDHRWRGISAVVSIALLGAVAGVVGVAAQDEAHAPAGDMRLADARPVEIEGTRIVSMSPDGTRLVALRPGNEPDGELCVFDVVSLDQQACGALSDLDAGIRVADVTWSPDSRWLAFAERTFELYVDGDLWLMDAATGEVTNLLDDAFQGRLPVFDPDPPAGTITVPVNPAFTPDSRSVTFSRTFFVDGKPAGNDIARVSLESGDVQPLVQVSDVIPGVAYHGIRWAPDGAQLYFSVSYPDGEDSRNGVWVVDADGTGQRQVLGRYQAEGTAPAVLQVAPDGAHLLVYDPALFGYGSGPAPVYATVDPADGTPTPLVPLSPDAPGYASIWWAGFSPDGSSLVTLQRPVEDAVVALRDVGATAEYPLPLELQGDDGPVMLGPVDRGLSPTWTPDGRLFLTGGGQWWSGMLLTIEGSAVAP